jgi:hypothetical protein
VVEGVDLDGWPDRGIREDYIQLVHGEFRQQPIRPIFTANHPNWRAKVERGFNKAMRNPLGQYIRNAHPQAERMAGRATLQGVTQFATERENFLGVAKNYVAHLRQNQPSPRPGE